MNAVHFTDDYIAQIESGTARFTEDERAFLLDEGEQMEECSTPRQELEVMPDAELMRTIYSAWSDYAR